ncbi:precorrin-6A reductase [Kyrpidia spormannii]|uniref:Precorrin-6A reductase n=1 Tax=Kyrpidia spormannii TaxID=2055160 RepID=A0A2K8N3V6_9BACL|nr:precorrin-6A reductase [Kyrpidia spormannii]ATY84138.1 precorrin-6A reductase [Kyrpidia spormannii]
MLFLLAGTSDARALGVQLQNAGYPVLASVVTESAASSLRKEGLSVTVGRKSADEMARLFSENGTRAVVDASHPFAEEASRNAMEAATIAGIPYIRYERPSSELSEHPNLHLARDYRNAAELAASFGGTIFLTTGSKTLPIFAEVLLKDPTIRMICRILPTEENMRTCTALGIPQRNIVAMQGPYTSTLNAAFYEHFGVTTLVTKESGSEGSVMEKIQPALDRGIHTIVICRPGIQYEHLCHSAGEVLETLDRLP